MIEHEGFRQFVEDPLPDSLLRPPRVQRAVQSVLGRVPCLMRDRTHGDDTGRLRIHRDGFGIRENLTTRVLHLESHHVTAKRKAHGNE